MNTHQNQMAFAVACLGIVTFAGMDALMKGIAIELGAYNAMLWRSLIALGMTGVLFCIRPAWPQRSALKIHIWRGMIISVMAFLFFWGLKYLPIAEGIALSFIAPLIALYLAAALLGETISQHSKIASVLGFVGALVIIYGRLQGDYDENALKGVFAILISAVLYAYNLILQRQQALVAGPIEIAFFQNCTLVAVYLCLAPFFAVMPDMTWVPNLTLAALFGIVSLMLVSWAYARAEAKVLIPVEYTAFIWAAIFGAVFYAEALTLTTILGTSLIVAGCLIAARQKPDQVEHVENTAV